MKSCQQFRLDGQAIPFAPGQTIMDAALAAGVDIPHLCHHPELPPYGSCRMCLVRADGRLVSACTAPAAADLEVASNTPDIQAMRRTLLQLLFVEGNHICPTCQQSGACQLQALAYATGMMAPHFPHFFPRRDLDASHPDFVLDFNRCILCALCVRASRDLDGKEVFAISGRGSGSHLVVLSPTGRLGDSRFSAADRAAHICPVGAILPKRGAFAIPIGQRRYDPDAIDTLGAGAANTREAPP